MTRAFRYLLSLLVLVVITGRLSTVYAGIINVPGQVPTIRGAIVIAENYDTIIVGSGTFSGPGNCDLELGGKTIVLRSLKGSTTTFINCEGSREDPHRGFYLHQGEGPQAVIDGFTIINGYAPFDGPGGVSQGGGILCASGTSPTIRNCVFYNNIAANGGGGMCCLNGSSPRITDCDFVDNTAIDDQHQFPGYGGAIRCISAAPIIRGCLFSSNRANVGGAMSCNQADVVIEECEFNSNTADVFITFEPSSPGAGGGAHFYLSSPLVDRCVFYRNVAISGMNMDYESAMGGGIAAFESSPVVERCSFFGNVAEKYYENFPGHGAGLFLNNSPALLQNCIVAFNYGAEGFECVSCTEPPDTSDLLCCDIYGNELGDWVGSIADQFGQNGNISEDPLFCDTVVADLFLDTASPCAAANSPCAGTIGAFDVGCATDAQDDNPSPRPRAFTLSQNAPNPFNQATVISFGLAATADVRLILYDVLGHPVRRLAGGVFPAGLHRVTWDGRDDSGDEVASGVYLYSLQVEGFGQTRKMILIK